MDHEPVQQHIQARRRAALRLYQLHEHLQLMDTGVESLELDDALRDACIEAAQTVWPQTGLSSWDTYPREAQYAYKCGDKLHG